MTIILHELPYHDTLTYAEVDRQLVQVIPHQIIVWVSITPRKVLTLPASVSRLPAVLDTGNSYGFAITERHLERWAGLTRQVLEELGSVNINRVRVPRVAATVWLHPNKKGERDAFRRQPPFRLDLREGIAVYPAAPDLQPSRLPVLGLRALDEYKLRCFLYADRLRVTLRTPPTPKRPNQAGNDQSFRPGSSAAAP